MSDADDMALEEYERKRNFEKTTEPAPNKVQKRDSKLAYLIQKHDATSLHYDFRLELDGVLLSWAVTKGPSLNPSDKRLAVRTEDHPLAYGSFEGTIPEGEYGGGTVMLWDQGTWLPKSDPHAGLKKGHLAFEVLGQRLKGGWNLIRMHATGKRENWLLIKEADQEANTRSNVHFLKSGSSSISTGRSMEEIANGRRSAVTKKENPAGQTTLKRLMDRYPEVQLATLVDTAPEGDDWVHEIKFDGYRLLGFFVDGDVCLRTRNGNDWTTRFPAIVAAMRTLKCSSAVIDMEAVTLDSAGKSSFQVLQAALGDGGNAETIMAYAFDLLYLDGKDFTPLPLTERKRPLETLFKKSKQAQVVRYSNHFAVEGAKMHKEACAKGLEGIISKLADAPYKTGRQKTWLKVKCALRQEFIIVGYSAARTGSRALGALYLGYKKDNELVYAGKAGTGFTMKSAGEIVERLEKLAVSKPVLTRAETKGMGAGEWKAVHWVKAALLCEVAFTEWTEDGRIRHPSFQGLREDKDAVAVKQEKPVHVSAPTKSHRQGKSDGLIAAGVTITHPDRVISEMGHVTKGELAEYHAAVAPFMLLHIARHPLSLLRCPSGIDGGECFFQRSPGRGFGKGVHPFEFRNKGKRYEYLYIDNAPGLLEIIQMGAVEIHPWGAPVDAIDYPDRLIFDLDPATDVPFEALKLAAQDLRQRLKRQGFESALKCTGGKGLHVTVPLAGKNRWAEVKAFGATVANKMVADVPAAYVATMSKAKRTGKIFIDYFRNDYTATAVADYGVRARPGAPVAVPLAWDELPRLKSASSFSMRDVLRRLKNHNPPAHPIGQTLSS
jgi:bifunctional non-homologous end joining protein LigD